MISPGQKYKKPPVWLVKRDSLSDSRLHRKKNKKSRIRYGYTKYRFGELRFRFCAEPSDAISAWIYHARTLIERIAGTSSFSKSIGRVFLYPGRTVPVHFRISVEKSGTSSSRNRIWVGNFRSTLRAAAICLYDNQPFKRRRNGCSSSGTRNASTGRFMGRLSAKRNSGRRYAGVSQLPHFKLRAHESVSRGNFLWAREKRALA